MNLIEALKIVYKFDGELWARPVGSKGWGITSKPDKHFYITPTIIGDIAARIPSAKYLFDEEWEVVSPKVILEERDLTNEFFSKFN